MRELIEALRAHVPADEEEAAHLARVRAFVARHPDPLDRRIVEGHVTGSAFVISHDGARLLLLHHKKLDRWLQPGGHGAPGERSALETALREAREETHLDGLVLHPSAPRPLDVDVHVIPARKAEAEHAHLDLRYLLVAPADAVARHDPEESLGLRWFAWSELEAEALEALRPDAGTRRALAKIRRLAWKLEAW